MKKIGMIAAVGLSAALWLGLCGCATPNPRPDGGLMPVSTGGQPGWFMHDGTVRNADGTRFRPSNSADLMAEWNLKQSSQGQSSGNTGDPVMQFMTDLNHALTPVAVDKQLQRGNYQGARELNANDQMLQRLNRMFNP